MHKERCKQFGLELTKAQERILSTSDGEVGWLLRFVQCDLESLTPSEWMVWAYEVASFADFSPGIRSMPRVLSESGWSVEAIPGEAKWYSLPSRAEALQLRQSVRRQLDDMWKTGYAHLTFPSLRLVVMLPGAFDDRHGTVLVATKRKAKEFEYRFAYLLAQYAGLIRPCKECQRIFLAKRRDQFYCDPRCQMRVATRKWRKGRANDSRASKQQRRQQKRADKHGAT